MILVCTACGSPSCWAGEFMCDDAFHASTSPCSCEWSNSGHGPSGAFPLLIDPVCPTHGEIP